MSNTEDYLRKHPFAGTAIALGLGVLLQVAAKTASGQRQSTTKTTARPREEPAKPRRLPAPKPHDVGPSKDTGVADMVFSSNHPDGRKISFLFSWKKRPVDEPESKWPVDHMGFKLDRPDGKDVSFEIVRKTRTLPARVRETTGDDSHSGFGRVMMQFKSQRPGKGDFNFTWTKTPPGETPHADKKASKRGAPKSTGR